MAEERINPRELEVGECKEIELGGMKLKVCKTAQGEISISRVEE